MSCENSNPNANNINLLNEKVSSPPRCHNVYGEPVKRRYQRKETVPLMFDVFNYDQRVMLDKVKRTNNKSNAELMQQNVENIPPARSVVKDNETPRGKRCSLLNYTSISGAKSIFPTTSPPRCHNVYDQPVKRRNSGTRTKLVLLEVLIDETTEFSDTPITGQTCYAHSVTTQNINDFSGMDNFSPEFCGSSIRSHFPKPPLHTLRAKRKIYNKPTAEGTQFERSPLSNLTNVSNYFNDIRYPFKRKPNGTRSTSSTVNIHCNLAEPPKSVSGSTLNGDTQPSLVKQFGSTNQRLNFELDIRPTTSEFNFDSIENEDNVRWEYDANNSGGIKGPPNVKCSTCEAWMWKEERVNKYCTKGIPEFSICCGKGEIQLPKEKPTPSYIWQLLNEKRTEAHFMDCIRMYNNLFAFTSMGGRVDHSVNCGGAPYVYRLNGQNHYLFGSLIPDEGKPPKFYQLYIYDTANETNNRLRWINVQDGKKVEAEIIEGLTKMLDVTNELVHEFRTQRDHFDQDQVTELEITLKISRSDSGRENHIVSADDIVGIMVGDLDENCVPTSVPTGDDGFHIQLKYGHSCKKKSRKRQLISMKEYYSYKFQVRLNEGGRLYQQYVVDAFSTIEQVRLWWFRKHQTTLLNELYRQISDSVRSGEVDSCNVGKGIILPAGFVGSRRYMQQNFQDALAVCRYIGHPDADSKKNLIKNVDNFVSAEIPDPLKDKAGYEAVKAFEIHEPCGAKFQKSLCMKDQKCIRHFPKKYSPSTTFDESGFPVYRRRKTDVTVNVRKEDLDNKWVVPYNRNLLVKYQCHMNVEICCHTRSIKYLFKYCLKGHDRATVEIKGHKKRDDQLNNRVPVDEINEYFDGRYICAAESAYHIFGYNIHYRTTSIQRLSFQLPGYPGARVYTYDEIPQHYIWNESDTIWNIRKRGKQIGSGGYGKTNLWKLLITKLRSESKIILLVASAGIAATLIPGGRTAHSRFKIPIVLDAHSTCAISHKADIAQLIQQTSVIIWDEAPMQHRFSFECLDRSLRDIMKTVHPHRFHMPFGGIIVILGGDFRKILLVIPSASRSQVELKENMRLTKGINDIEILRMANFAKWVLNIDDGKIDRARHRDAEEDIHKFQNPRYLSERDILTPTNNTVCHINDLIVDKIPGDTISYFSTDSAEDFPGSEIELNNYFPPEYLNSLNIPGLPNHELKLKVGVAVMLMRNLNQTLGLCNRTRMMVTKCLPQCVECEVITGSFIGSRHFIPRMEPSPSDTKLPFNFLRKQMPLQICYCMTINKSQGQSLENVGLFIPKPVFTHGQLYVAVNRENRMHILMSSAISILQDEVLVVGDTYEIENFRVTNFIAKYKCVEGDSHIIFTDMTIVNRVLPVDCLRLEAFFHFTDLGSIHGAHFQDNHCIDVDKMKGDNRFLIDVVGELEDSPTKIAYRKDEVERHNVKFTLTDGRCYVNVTFFNEFGESFLNALKGEVQKPIIVTIASAKINEWNGPEEMSATNFPTANTSLELKPTNITDNCRMQAFVPAFLNEKLQRMLQLGKMYVTSFFQVRDFTPEDKWRSVQLDRQIQFTNQTKTRELSESEYFIPNNMFDFYDFEEVRKLAKQNIYLADVVGVIIKREDIKQINTSAGKEKLQVKLKITDGKNKLNVTFWDSMAHDFQNEIDNMKFEYPLILIVASGKVSQWKETPTKPTKTEEPPKTQIHSRYEAIRVPILKPSEYPIWKVRMTMFLEATDPEYLDRIHEGPHKPTKLVVVVAGEVAKSVPKEKSDYTAEDC
ncbi:hypothetical protein AgCh_008622 [Apium graveolens]